MDGWIFVSSCHYLYFLLFKYFFFIIIIFYCCHYCCCYYSANFCLCRPVFFNLFSKAEPFAEILIAHRTHVSFWGGLLRSEGLKLDAKSRERERGSWGRGIERPPHQPGSGGVLSAPPAGFEAEPQPQIHCRPTKSLENTSSGGRKRPTQFNFILSTGGPAEPLGSVEPWLKNTGLHKQKLAE